MRKERLNRKLSKVDSLYTRSEPYTLVCKSASETVELEDTLSDLLVSWLLVHSNRNKNTKATNKQANKPKKQTPHPTTNKQTSNSHSKLNHQTKTRLLIVLTLVIRCFIS